MSALCLTILSLLIFNFYTYTAAADVKLNTDQLQDVVTELWFTDDGRATDGQIELNFQGHTTSRGNEDKAREKLFVKIDPQLLSGPTVESLVDLFTSYEASSDKNDQTTPERRRKTDRFLDAVLNTKVLEVLRRNLNHFGFQSTSNMADFRKLLNDIWFTDYSRAKNVRGSSSGFEHVFIGEIKNNEVSGLHNWIRFQWLEKRGDINYTGFIIKRPYIAMIQYKWGEYWKPSGSMFIGTSPEFDFAVYTLCFLAKPGQDACDFLIGDCTDIKITSFPWHQNSQSLIASAFPFPGKVTDNCKISQPSSPSAGKGSAPDGKGSAAGRSPKPVENDRKPTVTDKPHKREDDKPANGAQEILPFVCYILSFCLFAYNFVFRR